MQCSVEEVATTCTCSDFVQVNVVLEVGGQEGIEVLLDHVWGACTADQWVGASSETRKVEVSRRVGAGVCHLSHHRGPGTTAIEADVVQRPH